MMTRLVTNFDRTLDDSKVKQTGRMIKWQESAMQKNTILRQHCAPIYLAFPYFSLFFIPPKLPNSTFIAVFLVYQKIVNYLFLSVLLN